MANKDVKVIPAGSKERTQPTAEAARRMENERIDNARQRLKKIKTQADLPIGHRDKIDAFKSTERTTSGISGKGGVNVSGLYKPMGMGSGMNWQTK